jgi:hypothetical protein
MKLMGRTNHQPELKGAPPLPRPAEAFIGNKTRHAVKCLDEALDRIEEAYRCFLDCARELREQATPLETFRNKIVDVIGEASAPPSAIDTAQLEADITLADEPNK